MADSLDWAMQVRAAPRAGAQQGLEVRPPPR